MEKLKGLDTLRAVAALWVFFSHLTVFREMSSLPGSELSGNLVSKIFSALIGIAFSGPAAVSLFFVISGLCIHLSTRRDQVYLGPFLARRFLRVGVPLLVAILFCQISFGSTEPINGVVWSLYCELIYYFIYPWLFLAARRIGWISIFSVSFFVAVSLTLFVDGGGYFWSYGIFLTWIIGLPAWLLGVVIAEKLDQPGWAPKNEVRAIIWLAVWAASSFALILHFHLNIYYKYSLQFFAVISALFVLWELRSINKYGFIVSKKSRFFEWLGTWSFSLYLCHPMAIYFFHDSLDLRYGKLTIVLAAIFSGFFLSLIFFYCIEKPAHSIARSISLRTPKIAALTAPWSHRAPLVNAVS